MSRKNLMQIANKYKPKGVVVRWKAKRLTLTDLENDRDMTIGIALPKTRTQPATICVPRVTTRFTLHLFLHECAHHILGHLTHPKERYIEEWEAEKWAMDVMKLEGVPLPKPLIDLSQNYIINQFIKAHMRPDIYQWVNA